MGLFKKRGSDVIDLTDMQKRGILKSSEKKEEDFVDFSPSPVQTAPKEEVNPFGFLDSLAGSAVSGTGEPPIKNEDKQIQHLKVKIEDLEYKLDNFLDRLAEIEKKIH
jgi:hypothetical protein